MAIDHFEKHYYQKGRVDWNFNILFDGQPAVAEMAKQYSPLLQHDGLYDPIPPQWLHSTILRVGLTDDYTEEEMPAVADKLQEKLVDLKLPEFFFDSWWIWSGNVVLHISPDDQFTKIYEAVMKALEEVLGKERTSKSVDSKFIAHTTLVYSKTYDKEREVRDQLLASLVKPASFKATKLSLIKQWPTDGHYEWEIVRAIPIG